MLNLLKIKRFNYAIVAGLCASGGSFFGKLMGDFGENNIFNEYVIVKGAICLTLMILCNLMVWVFFVRALHSEGGTLVATTTSSASSYVISTILGALIFNEKFTMLSASGLFLVFAGVLFLTMDKDSNIVKKD